MTYHPKTAERMTTHKYFCYFISSFPRPFSCSTELLFSHAFFLSAKGQIWALQAPASGGDSRILPIIHFLIGTRFLIYESGFGAEKYTIKMPDTVGCVWLIDDKPLGGERCGT